MNSGKPNDRDRLIEFIAATVESMREQMATRSDVARLETELDATNTGLDRLETNFARLEQKTDAGLTRLEQRTGALEQKVDGLERKVDGLDRKVDTLEQKMDVGFIAVRGDIERVAVRMDMLDRSVTARNAAVQAEVSRIRSVVYLLVKDQPELVRLLGGEPA